MLVTGQKAIVEGSAGDPTNPRRAASGIRARSAVRVAGLLAAAMLVLAACSPGAAEPSGGSSGASAETPATSTGGQSGAKALSFTATTLESKKMDVSTLEGSPVVLWFWAPWCSICRAEAPDVAKVAAELDGRVTFLGVPGLGQENDMRAFVKDTGLSGFKHLVDSDGSLWQRFGVVAQPAFAFVAADGSVEVSPGALDLDAIRERAGSLVVKG